MQKRIRPVINLAVAITMIVSLMAIGLVVNPAQANQSSVWAGEVINDGGLVVDDGPAAEQKVSHRLIVQLQSPPAVEWAKAEKIGTLANGRLNLKNAAVQMYIQQLKVEQAAFVSALQQALPQAEIGTFVNEFGQNESLTYQVVVNGLVVEPGSDTQQAFRVLSGMPGVKGVFYDYAHDPELYASLPLINAQAAWDNTAIGGKANAGEGVKVASMDGGAHKDAAMFSGTGFSYPADYPAGGLGLTANNNGKIIASRVYFRAWDPPSAGDENPWPGTQGTSHGTHTASTAAGNEVLANMAGYTTTISGVAPAAWVMSYRVFYNSITDDGSFYDAEGIAALEDIAVDQPDVLNNSWGGGPGSAGGEFDLLDTALLNTALSGVFISMSAGNAGPEKGTTDHPSDAYISVAASTTDGTIASGKFNVIAPQPISSTLQSMAFSAASFGGSLPDPGDVVTYTFKTASSAGNVEGCTAFPTNYFTGTAALIRRGTCEFGLKALNAQNAGAVFVVVYNNAGGGDSLINMGAGAVGNQVTIPAIFTWHSKGVGMESWYSQHGNASVMELDMRPFQAGNVPDVLASFSSRGPGVGLVLKPDIAAPGVNILAQGYGLNVTGEARHLGFGQASGTSMAAPHVTGAAALLRQIHPTWPNSSIKSALMTTSKYIGVYNHTGTHAQPLDMGAGRLDLTNAADPGVIVQPTSVSMGQIVTGTPTSQVVWVTNISDAAETFNLSAVKVTATGFLTPTVGALPGFSVSPASLALDPGETDRFTVTFTSSAGVLGDNQGWIVMDGPTHDAHMPAWVRNIGATGNRVLVVDKDGASSGANDFRAYYTNALTTLGHTYDVVTTVPDGATLAKYDVVIYYTGNSYQTTITSTAQANALVEYANQGGIVIAMGQDLASTESGTSTSSATFFYGTVLGGEYLQDSVTADALPAARIVPIAGAPPELQNVAIDLGGKKTNTVDLVGSKEVPPVATLTYGTGKFGYVDASNTLSWDVTVVNPLTTTAPITVTASHIHTGTVTTNGPALFTLFTGPQVVTSTLNFKGTSVLSADQEAALKSNRLYVNVHTTGFPAGEIRGQVSAAINGDGAGNQYWIDENATFPNDSPEPVYPYHPYQALFTYPGAFNVDEGVTGMAHRDQPTLERPGISYFGRSVYTTFGLEGVNNGLPNAVSREGLLQAFLDWAMDEPSVMFTGASAGGEGDLTVFTATVSSNITGVDGWQYRWDFGDGSEYTPLFTSSVASHTYMYCGLHIVRVEAVDTWGNHVVYSKPVMVTDCSTNSYRLFLPVVATP